MSNEKPVDYMQPTRSARAVQLERAEEHAGYAQVAMEEYSQGKEGTGLAWALEAIVHALLAIAAATAARGE